MACFSPLFLRKRRAQNEMKRSGARENEENFNLNKHHSAFLCEEWRIYPLIRASNSVGMS